MPARASRFVAPGPVRNGAIEERHDDGCRDDGRYLRFNSRRHPLPSGRDGCDAPCFVAIARPIQQAALSPARLRVGSRPGSSSVDKMRCMAAEHLAQSTREADVLTPTGTVVEVRSLLRVISRKASLIKVGWCRASWAGEFRVW